MTLKLFTMGDRVPDFSLPNQEGRLGSFYDRFQGDPVVLCFCPDRAASEKAGFFAEIFTALHDLVQAGATPVLITRLDHGENARIAQAHGYRGTLFSDPAGAITEGFGVVSKTDPTGSPHSLLLDANQRVLGSTDVNGLQSPLSSQVPDWLARLGRLAGAPSPTITAQAPVLLIPRVLEPSFCEEVIEAWRQDHGEGEVRRRAATGGATRAVDFTMKKRLDHRPNESLNHRLAQKVIGRISPEVFRAFQFGTNIIEHFCIGAYDAQRGDYFRPHRDNTTPQTAPRRFAVTLNLNGNYDGGALRFPEFGRHLYTAPAGGAIVFSCSLMHEATPVTRGRRFVALTFLVDQAAAQQRMAPPRR